MDMSLEKRHSHHSMETMSMGAGVPGLRHMQKVFWAFIGTAIAVAVVANVINMIIYYQRLSSASRRTPNPAKPKSLFFQTHATLSAVVRESGYYSAKFSIRKFNFYLPPMGPVLIMVAYIVLIVVCSLYGFNTSSVLDWEDIGYRTGFIAIAQIPLIVLLAGKRNIIGLIVGVGYERLNWLHRWVARALLFTILIHMGYWMTVWGKYDYIMVKMRTDYLTRIGMAAFGVLVWLVLSSVAPIRGLSYEFFVIQHVISYLGFLVAVFYHVPEENRIFVWLPLAFWAFDRAVRTGYLFYNNAGILHKDSNGLLACKATFEPLDSSHTRVTIANPPVAWTAGQHMFLACHALAPLTSHPFTIASLPEDEKMEFIICAKKGGTKKFFSYASKAFPTLPTSNKKDGRSVILDGPYSRIRPLRQFDSLIFIAGSTGATFTTPLLRDVVQQWTNSGSTPRFGPASGAVTRHIRFIWVIKRSASASWFAAQLEKVQSDVEELRNRGHDVAVEISIYVTCDDTLTSAQSSIKEGKNPEARHSNTSSMSNEKNEIKSEVLSRSSSLRSEKGCCCTRVVDEDIDAVTAPCSCAGPRAGPGSSQPSPRQPPYNTFTGRPNIPNIIRRTAELALGEMAIVVCGPPGLVQSTRNAAVGVSDERAVHKGTGAQGIYVHAEMFGYA
ncbi:ferric reductase like transmembrane component [Phlyctema vagabunda]|uniref:ferric-chelate reductase (NADPH) n=1 Tax=Phlyctema vagabunda TaxID=108571 RepID=A0ABR4PGA6_9HELO